MQHSDISLIEASEVHPDTFVSRDAMCRTLAEAAQLMRMALAEQLTPEERLKHLAEARQKLESVKAGPEMIGVSKAKFESLGTSLRMAINPDLVRVGVVLDPDEPFYA